MAARKVSRKRRGNSPAAKKKVGSGKRAAPALRSSKGRSKKLRQVRRTARKTAVRAVATQRVTADADRLTPLVEPPVQQSAVIWGPNKPSRIITTRPRPPLRQIDPRGPTAEAARTLEPWEVDVDDLAQLIVARMSEETREAAPPPASPESVARKIHEAREAGWVDDPRPSGSTLPDARLRLVHPACKYLDGKRVRDVALSVHSASGRASVTLEGGDRARIVSWIIAESEDLPSQLDRILADPARLTRVELASGRELLARLDELDRSLVAALGDKALAHQPAERLLGYVRDFAALESSYGLPATVDAVWDRFGVRKGSVLERLGLEGPARQRLCDLFDRAIDGA